MSDTAMIAAIFLAAGLSSRSGKANKLLYSHKGKTLINHSLDAAITTQLDCRVVLGGRKEAFLPHIPKTCKIIENTHYTDGITSSIRAGINSLDDTISLAFLCLADMPFVHPSTYEQLIDSARQNPDKNIFIPTNKGQQGNPVLWRRPLFKALAALSGDKGGKQLFKAHKTACMLVEVNNSGILLDLDTQKTLHSYNFTEEAP